jgi:hypothetical protein
LLFKTLAAEEATFLPVLALFAMGLSLMFGWRPRQAGRADHG